MYFLCLIYSHNTQLYSVCNRLNIVCAERRKNEEENWLFRYPSSSYDISKKITGTSIATMLWSCNTYSYCKQLYSSITTYIVIPYENVSDVTSAATIWFSRSNLLKLFLDNVHCTFRATLDTSLSSPPLRPLQISQQCIFMLFYTYKKLGLAYVGFLFLLHSQ